MTDPRQSSYVGILTKERLEWLANAMTALEALPGDDIFYIDNVEIKDEDGKVLGNMVDPDGLGFSFVPLVGAYE